MTPNDSLYRFLFEEAPVRGEFIRLTDTYQSIVEQHAYPPIIRNLLGEALCVSGLLTAIIKFSGRLTLQYRGTGHVKFLLAQCDSEFNMRGLVKWEGALSEEMLIKDMQQGTLSILLDSDKQKNRYQGTVAWSGASLAESIESYFQHSEQLQTRIFLSVGEKSASGMLLQVTPDKRAHNIAETEPEVPEWEPLSDVSSFFDQRDMLELSTEDLLRKIYPEDDIRLFPPVPVQFACTCSRKRGEEAISVLGQEEAEAELKDKQLLVVTCDFCNKEYTYDKIDVATIFAYHSPPDTHLH